MNIEEQLRQKSRTFAKILKQGSDRDYFFKVWGKNHFKLKLITSDLNSFSFTGDTSLAYFPEGIDTIETRHPHVAGLGHIHSVSDESKIDLNKAYKNRCKTFKRRYTAYLNNILVLNQGFDIKQFFMHFIIQNEDSNMFMYFERGHKTELVAILKELFIKKIKGKLKAIKKKRKVFNIEGLTKGERISGMNKLIQVERKNKTINNIKKFILEYNGLEILTQKSISKLMGKGFSHATIRKHWNEVEYLLPEFKSNKGRNSYLENKLNFYCKVLIEKSIYKF